MIGYNGWSNYPTWCVNLWLTNDEGISRDLQDVCAAHESMYDLEDALKEYVVELLPELEGFGSDLLGWAVDNVEWRELAESYRNDWPWEGEDEEDEPDA